MSKHAEGEKLGTRSEYAAIRDRDLDREVSSDWFEVDNEAWHKLDIAESEPEPGRGGARSISRRSTQR